MVEPRRAHGESGKPHTRREPPRTTTVAGVLRVVFTLDPTTHQVLTIEELGQAGARHELSVADCAALIGGDDDLDELEAAVDEAYEAGIAEGLGADDEDDDDLAMHELEELLLPRHRRTQDSVRSSLLRRLLFRRLLRRRLSRPASAPPPQRRKPTADAPRNGAA